MSSQWQDRRVPNTCAMYFCVLYFFTSFLFAFNCRYVLVHVFFLLLLYFDEKKMVYCFYFVIFYIFFGILTIHMYDWTGQTTINKTSQLENLKLLMSAKNKNYTTF